MTASGDGPISFPPLSEAEWPAALDDMREGFAGKLGVYRVMAHDPELLRAWAPLREHVVRQNALGQEFSEVVILRTGHRLGSVYEWSHHVSRARAIGMDDARIASIAGAPSAMHADDATLARAVDALLRDARLSRQAAAEVEALVGVKGLFDVIATVGFYSTLAFIVNSFGTPVDRKVAAELAERPLPTARA